MPPAQLALFADPTARYDDPAPSHAAAELIAPHTAAVEHDIVAAFRAHPAGLTDDELCRHLEQRYPPTVKTARSRLAKTGRLVPTGERLSLRGRPMTVWRLP